MKDKLISAIDAVRAAEVDLNRYRKLLGASEKMFDELLNEGSIEKAEKQSDAIKRCRDYESKAAEKLTQRISELKKLAETRLASLKGDVAKSAAKLVAAIYGGGSIDRLLVELHAELLTMSKPGKRGKSPDRLRVEKLLKDGVTDVDTINARTDVSVQNIRQIKSRFNKEKRKT